MTESTRKVIERRIKQLEWSIKDSKGIVDRAWARINSGRYTVGMETSVFVYQNNMQEAWIKELEELKHDLKENCSASSCSETERH